MFIRKKYHFTGIGGVGMAGVAYLLKKAGHEVSGCDLHRSPRTRWLEANGIHVDIGHSPSHITPDLDVCVFTPAVPGDSPEFLAGTAMQGNRGDGKPEIRYRGEILAEMFNETDGIAVCGTHGKTTTATFIAKLLRALGEDPSWCIGGETGDFPVAGTGCLRGMDPDVHGTGPESRCLIVEADESDGTLALYRAKTLVVTSLDYDHPDHFKTYSDYLACYRTAMDAASEVIETSRLPMDDWPEIRPLVLGEHNVRNARTAVEVALRRGHSREEILGALPAALAALPDRRFERIWPPDSTSTADRHSPGPRLTGRQAGAQPSVRIYTDYAHHPAEIACALSMARSLDPKRLRVIFQPHRHSRTRTLLDEFPAAFDDADEIVLMPVYSAFEKPIPGGDIADLYRAFRIHAASRGADRRPPILARSAEEAWRHMFLTTEPGDVVMVLGAGDLIGIVPRIISDMSTAARPGTAPIPLSRHSFFRTGGVTYGRILHSMQRQECQRGSGDGNGAAGSQRHLIVGMGSNTWFSDCATDIDIVVAPDGCQAARPGASLIHDHPELAFMAGIPGTIGGWAKMNAGAFGDSFGNHVDYVIADGRRIPAEQCGFGYRTSSIRGLITEVAIRSATPTDAQGGGQPQDCALATPGDFLARRRRFPPRTCGSVFKNPSTDMPAGRLLEEAGAKSLRVGGAYVWDGHANVIVAGDGCTSSDILALARLMAARVRERFGVVLTPEITGLNA